MVFNLNLGTSPGKNSQVLAFVEKNSFTDWKFASENFSLSFENSQTNEVLNLIDYELLFRPQLVDVGVLIPDFGWPDHHF
jgi:hypothetical protein